MPTSTASVAYRPIRLGLIVRDDEIADLVKAAELSTLLWGGIRNPLISVSDDPSEAKALMDLFAVDVVVCVSDSTEVETFANEFPFLRSPSMGEGLFYEDWVSKKLRLQYLDIINLVDSIWNDELKHSSASFTSAKMIPAADVAHVPPNVGIGFYKPITDAKTDFQYRFYGVDAPCNRRRVHAPMVRFRL